MEKQEIIPLTQKPSCNCMIRRLDRNNSNRPARAFRLAGLWSLPLEPLPLELARSLMMM
jgi:hypothetical protein